MPVVIGIKLVESVMKTYLVEGVDHVRVILSIALIAIARKIIILDFKKVSSLSLIGIGVIILALAFGYFFRQPSERPGEIRSLPKGGAVHNPGATSHFINSYVK